MKKIIIAVLVLALAGAGFWAYTRTDKNPDLVLWGNVDQREVDLAFLDSERIAEVLAEEGSAVKKGQVLARLETRRLRDRIAASEASLAAAEAALKRDLNGTRPEDIDRARAAAASAKAETAYAKATWQRYAGLWKRTSGTAVSRQDVDEAKLKLDVARAREEEAQKALRLAEIGPRAEDIDRTRAERDRAQAELTDLKHRLEDAELVAPTDAIVSKRLLEAGDMASPSRAVFSLAVTSPKWVRAWVGESSLSLLKPGMAAEVTCDSFPGEKIPGTVGFISPTAQFTPKNVETEDLRTALVYEVRVYVKDEDNRLRLGMPATVTFRDARRSAFAK
jgi:HlyD family secretion protein